MTTSWYSVTIGLPDSVPVFNGYFTISTNTPTPVTYFYQTVNGSTNFSNSVLMAVGAQKGNDNVFNNPRFSSNGVAFTTQYLNIGGINITSITLFSNQVKFFTLDAAQDISGYTYTTAPVENPFCFNEGTKILSLTKQFKEEYVPIENLKKGNLIKTHKHGYRRIELIGKKQMINNPEKWYGCMYKMKKTEKNGLLEDLIVTGGHSLLVDKLEETNEQPVMIDDKYLLFAYLSKDFVKLENIEMYTYYHFVLENSDDNGRFGVWANGVLTETTFKNDFVKHNYTLL